jgi:Domain of unknown function (DUF4168)
LTLPGGKARIDISMQSTETSSMRNLIFGRSVRYGLRADRTISLALVSAIAGLSVGLIAGPALAQSGAPSGSPATAAPALSDAVVNKAGAAFRQVSQIKKEYLRQIQATSDTERQQALERQADDASVRAVEGQGLSVDQYDQVIRLAKADPGVRARLLGTGR